MEGIADSPDSFSTAFEVAFGRFQVTVEEACVGQSEWPQQIAAAIRAGLEFAAADPASASLLTTEALAHGADGLGRYRRLLTYLATAFTAGRDERSRPKTLPLVTEKALAGGLLGLVAERIRQEKAAELPALAPEAIQFVLTPYLGMEEARRVARSSDSSGPSPER